MKKQVTNLSVRTVLGVAAFSCFIVLAVLKHYRIVNWSWWWVTCPIWILPLVALLGLLLVIQIDSLDLLKNVINYFRELWQNPLDRSIH